MFSYLFSFHPLRPHSSCICCHRTVAVHVVCRCRVRLQSSTGLRQGKLCEGQRRTRCGIRVRCFPWTNRSSTAPSTRIHHICFHTDPSKNRCDRYNMFQFQFQLFTLSIKTVSNVAKTVFMVSSASPCNPSTVGSSPDNKEIMRCFPSNSKIMSTS